MNDLYRNQNSHFTQYFYDLVSKEYAPNYYKIIKQPIDLSSLKRNLDQKVYQDANAFYNEWCRIVPRLIRSFRSSTTASLTLVT